MIRTEAAPEIPLHVVHSCFHQRPYHEINLRHGWLCAPGLAADGAGGRGGRGRPPPASGQQHTGRRTVRVLAPVDQDQNRRGD
jgi:hypothetical protein